MQPIKLKTELILKETEELTKAVALELEEVKNKTEAMIKKTLKEIVSKYIDGDEKD